jgi:uncharacterized protein (TIRG00374 family)
MFNKAFVLFLVKIILTAGIIFLLVHNLNIKELLSIMDNTSLAPSVASVCLVWLGLSMAAKRWAYVISVKAVPPVFFQVWRQTMVGFFFNQLLPSSVGGDAYRGMSLKQYGMPLEWAFSSTIIDRIYGVTSLLIVAIFAIPFQISTLQKTILGEMMLVSFILILCALVGLLSLQYLPIRWPKKLIFIESFSKTLKAVFWNGRTSMNTLLVSIISTFLLLVPYKLLADDMGIMLSLSQILVSIPLVVLIAVLPISFAGWGLREGAMVLVLHVFGIPKESALAFSLVMGGLQIAAALPGAILWFVKNNNKGS